MAIIKDATELMWASGGVLDQVSNLAKELGWEQGDELIVKLAGTRTSGLQASDTANPRWHPKPGAVVHNKDCQIVIENLSRRDLTKSTPFDEDTLIAKFRVDSSGQLYTSRELEELPEPTPVVDTRTTPWYNVIDRIRKTLSK